jgi:hypothetical protein
MPLRRHLQHLAKALHQTERRLKLLTVMTPRETDEWVYQFDLFFGDGVLNFFIAEETYLFPALDTRHEGPLTITAQLRAEARRLRADICEFRRMLRDVQHRLPDIQRRGISLIAALRVYYRDVEELAYPLLDASITADTFTTEIARPLFGHPFDAPGLYTR